MKKTKIFFYTQVLPFLFLASCHMNQNREPIQKKDTVETQEDYYGMPAFLNSLNVPEMNLPVAGYFASANKQDTLDFDMKPSDEYLYDFRLFLKSDTINTLAITIASDVRFYDEGDLDGDGVHEIGILPGYTTSACRNYLVYSFKNHKWKLLFRIDSHLADRERGIDYVKREGTKIRILSADDGCCQCFGLDTSYVNIK
jgi:hypothetical protein